MLKSCGSHSPRLDVGVAGCDSSCICNARHIFVSVKNVFVCIKLMCVYVKLLKI
jgi:hypothetical protein